MALAVAEVVLWPPIFADIHGRSPICLSGELRATGYRYDDEELRSVIEV